MCTGNSCRSIIAEALINAKLEGFRAKSCGTAPIGKVNENAKKVLKNHGIWNDSYHSKHLDELIEKKFDLVVTVCDHAKEKCPIFPKPLPKIHEGFIDPHGKDYDAFESTYEEIRKRLLPRIKAIFSGDVKNLKSDDLICYCKKVDKATIEQAIDEGADTLFKIKESTKACTGSSCKENNPLKRCCAKEINTLIKSKGKKMKKNVFKTTEGVKIQFSGAVAKEQIVKMVKNCATGQCECMSENTKKKIDDMQVDGKDGDVKLHLKGDISKEEIETALSKSKVLNKT